MSSLVMEIEDYVLPAGVAVPVSRRATYFLLMTGSDVDVEFSFKGSRIGGGVGLQGGDAVGPLSQPYDQVTLTSATAQTVKIATSSDPVTITRLSGTVSVAGVVETAPDYSRVKNGEAFMAAMIVTESVGNYAVGQIWNDAAETVNLVVTGIDIVTATASDIVYLRATDVEGNSGNLTSFAEKKGQSILISSPNSESGQNSVKTGLTSDFNTLPSDSGERLAGYKDGSKILAQPIVIEPGAGLVFITNGTNKALIASVQYYEAER